MVDEPPPNGPIDLDALDDYLMSDLAPDESMGLSDLDGFLTGLVVGPELILPSEWLPVIWGGEEPEFQTEVEMRSVIGTIMRTLQRDRRLLRLGAGRFRADILGRAGGRGNCIRLGGGFLDAVALRPTSMEAIDRR